MKKTVVIILITVTLFSLNIKKYTIENGCIIKDNQEYKVLRGFEYKNIHYNLVVNTSSLKSYIIKSPKQKIVCSNSSRYFKLLNFSSLAPFPLQNDGITQANKGLYLTTDLCPSSKAGFEDRLYKALIDNFKNPVPVTLFITKSWIIKHPKEFYQFKIWQNKRQLNIIWGNHTANHIYHPKLPLNENFVLSKEENLTKDILDNEEFLIENGITPSIFFRFPGLVSNKEAILKVKDLGLITIGSNAWLAKGQKIKDGSIILIHGNKNEPKGVDMFLKLLKEKKIKSLNLLYNIQ